MPVGSSSVDCIGCFVDRFECNAADVNCYCCCSMVGVIGAVWDGFAVGDVFEYGFGNAEDVEHVV